MTKINLQRFFVTILSVFILNVGCSKSTDSIGGSDNSQNTNTVINTPTEKPVSDQTDNTSPLGFVSNAPDAQGKGAVIVKGSGTDYESAKKDAMKNAVREVVSAIVEPEARASLSESIAKSINNYNAFTEQCEILSRKRADGMIDIKAEIIVQQKALQTQLVPSEIKVKTFDGANIAKRLNEKIKSDNDAVMLVADFLRAENFPYSCLEVKAKLNPKPVKTVGDELTMEIDATVAVNEKNFDAFSKKFIKILEKIKTGSGTLSLEGHPSENDMLGKFVSFNFPKNEDESKFRCGVNTAHNKTLTNTVWNYYDLSPKFEVLFCAYKNLYVRIDVALNDVGSRRMMSTRMSCYNLIESGADSQAFLKVVKPPKEDINHNHYYTNYRNKVIECIKTGSAIFQYENIQSAYKGGYDTRNFMARSVYILPFPTLTSQSYFSHDRSVTLTREITLTSEELSSVKSVTSRVMSESPTMDEFYKDLPELLNKFPQ
ncbi:MAG: hypothetical protein LBJ00_15315 [Planctomycetaceae bacterium]|jgi:hypothetical protein|nr:hypothetical protein [Planctomycetaceae bacterium]